MNIPSPQFAREQDKEPSIEITDFLEDKTLPSHSDLSVTHEEIAALALDIYQEEDALKVALQATGTWPSILSVRGTMNSA